MSQARLATFHRLQDEEKIYVATASIFPIVTLETKNPPPGAREACFSVLSSGGRICRTLKVLPTDEKFWLTR